MTAQMRTGPAARDAEFRGIDPPALNALIKQVTEANAAIRSWLGAHRPPPGVAATGYRQADQVAQWASEQLGMLSRRYSFAVTHPDPGGGVTPPPAVPPPSSGAPKTGGGTGGGAPHRTPAPRPPKRAAAPPHRRGAGDDLGNFPTRQAAAKAARADALAVAAAVQDHKPVPGEVWKHLKANADDPDYTEKLYERLGPAGAAGLLKAAHGDQARLKVIEESLGTASHHLAMDAKWLRAFLAEADRAGVRPVAVQVLTGADMSARTRQAVAGLRLKAAAPSGREEG
ncbi:hypothetical protein [Actinomadura macrotermitis]|uniref:Uncharacterized protein n=1 Tax=Actinomadura macrotermitis TaxID=2585200 RepID=A0A7K0BMP8_9ACTN|nr:hypothetical protein [Actinomadura macrotermitis]MQY02433.1 hypothetical protein [Actinomadura macrotermitis]